MIATYKHNLCTVSVSADLIFIPGELSVADFTPIILSLPGEEGAEYEATNVAPIALA